MGAGKLKTSAVHAGAAVPQSKAVSISPPVHLASVSYFERAEDLDRSLDGADFVYGRNRAQNTELLEEAIASLEGAEACAAFATGMAALRAVLEVQPLSRGDRVVITSAGYGTTRVLYKTALAARGVELQAFALVEPTAVEKIAALQPKFVLAESITNPLISVADVRAIAKACKQVGAVFAVDATFASPVLQRPLELGADYAIHSTTKWINGHGDAMGGAVSGTRERIEPLKNARVLTGSILGPFEAWLTLRGLRTLPVRMKAHCEHAERVAQRLLESPAVERVLYPSLTSHPTHAVARQVLDGGFGGMLAFELRGAGRAESFRFLEQVKLA
ncbi:MAG TPA: PLP-dependent aspartate aminotransferase family protein, partial [Myxococcaceae bacterium]|nr:PLP-dependent aspartate aminotransferase family protein [Myxococcaceae bacterium]